MLVLVQFPLVDLRSFLGEPSGRLTKPTFPVLDPPTGRGRDWFVRSTGAIRRRFSGDKDQLVSEDYYCDASRLVKFAARPLVQHPLHAQLEAYIAFRRLFWDGRWDRSPGAPPRPASLVGRVDVGIGLKGKPRGHEMQLDGRQVELLLQAMLAEKILGVWQARRTPGNVAAGDSLSSIGPAIAATLLRGTTKADARQQAIDNNWWMQPGRQSIIVEFNSGSDVNNLPRKARSLSLPQLWEESSLRVHFYLLNHQGALVPVWFVGHSFEYHRRDERARLRRCLSRMNAEIAALQTIGRMAGDGRFQALIDRPEAGYFRHFVTSALQQIQADRRQGVAQTVMTDLVLSVMEAATPGDFANLRSVFSALDPRGQHLVDRFLNRVDATARQEPLTYRYDFFLAHSSRDSAVTTAIHQALLARSAKVFLDSQSLEPGDIWPDRLLAEQKASRVTVALVSENSVKSPWFKSECVTAINLLGSGLAHGLVPVLLDGSEMPYGTNIVQSIALPKGRTIDHTVDALMTALERVREAESRASAFP